MIIHPDSLNNIIFFLKYGVIIVPKIYIWWKSKLLNGDVLNMNDKNFDYSINVFEYVLGYSADEWKELDIAIKKYGDDLEWKE